jgi:hypothetical protein
MVVWRVQLQWASSVWTGNGQAYVHHICFSPAQKKYRSTSITKFQHENSHTHISAQGPAPMVYVGSAVDYGVKAPPATGSHTHACAHENCLKSSNISSCANSSSAYACSLTRIGLKDLKGYSTVPALLATR